MIVTLTCNPSLDRTLCLSNPRRGEVNHAACGTIEPSGGGVNVSRALVAHGVDTTAVLPCGGVTGRQMAILLSDAQVPFDPVPVGGALRVNTAVVEPDGTATWVNETGPLLCPEEAFALLACTDDLAERASWLAVCGPLAPGLPDDYYATVIRRAHTYGAQVAVDAPGEALRLAIDAGPDLIASSRTELAKVAGRDLARLDDVRRVAGDLVRSGIPMVVVTLGRDGALLVTDRTSIHARAICVRTVSTAGAREALLAGMLHALDRGVDPAQALITGVRWGTAAVQLLGAQPPTPADVAATSVSVSTRGDEPVVHPPSRRVVAGRPRHRLRTALARL